jgi:RNA polymerase sigma-70 factor (ECF subfamily)
MAEDRVFDELLVIRSQDGDKQALTLLIKRWNRKMLSKAYIMTNDQESCNDIVQECWLQIIRGLKGLKDPKYFGVWAYRIVQGKSVDWIRDRQKQRKTIENEKLESKDALIATVSDRTDQEVAVAKLRIALKELPPDQQFILSMHYLENHPVNEIGEILKIPTGTVKSRLFHARKNLLKIFKKIRQ